MHYLAGEENLITCNPLYRDHTLTLSCTQLYFNTYIGSLCLAPAGWEKMQARKWCGDEVNEKEQLLTVLHPSWICFLFLPMEIKENGGGFPAGGRQ